jgi:soluble P-type ATPase
VTISVDIPGETALEIEHLLLDVNGTLTDRGKMLPGVGRKISRLRRACKVHLLTADTFGTLAEVAQSLGVEGRQISSGAEKRDFALELGPDICAAIGNGRNDAEMLTAVRLGIVVLGPEGLSSSALSAADVLCPSIEVALNLLLEPKALSATLRP